MRIAILAAVAVLAAPFVANAKTVTLGFDGLDYSDEQYEEKGFMVSFSGNGWISGSSAPGQLELHDGGTGTATTVTFSALDGSPITLVSAIVGISQWSPEPYNGAELRREVGGEIVETIRFRPNDAQTFRAFNTMPADAVSFEAIRYSGPGYCTSPCSSLFFTSVTLEKVDISPVPLPASAPMLLAGIGALWWRRKKGGV